MDGGLNDRAVAEAHDMAALWRTASDSLRNLYGRHPDFESWLISLRRMVEAAAAARSDVLKAWDRSHAEWWKRPATVGYSTYVDRFGGTLRGVEDRIGYLEELGVTYLHLLPLMKPRAGESDGGYAVADFEDVNPALGTLDDFRALLDSARDRDVQVVTDLVCNHVADDHRWAAAAKAGDPRHRDFFHVIADRAEVDRWEADLLDVFPDSAPGNFTWSDELQAWVWTSFYPYQWDLNYANPAVFEAMTSTLLNLANLGVSGFRLDSTGFLWKQEGTTSRNLPQVHDVLVAWRALLSIVAPGVVMKAEAIDRLEEVLPYFGSETRPECDLAYANGVMAAGWASLALQSAQPVQALIQAAAARPGHGAWINYVRCHDDIIFAGLAPEVSRERQREAAQRLTAGGPGAFGDGEVFQTFDGVPSVNGMTASLCGVPDDALGEARLKLLYGVCFALDGTPVIYMGDEIALPNDRAYTADPERADEGRWLQRPAMDWPLADAAVAGTGVAGSVRQALSSFARRRATHPAFEAAGAVTVDVGQPETVLGLLRGSSGDRIQVLANFSDQPVIATGAFEGAWRDLLSDREGQGRDIRLEPYGLAWIEARP